MPRLLTLGRRGQVMIRLKIAHDENHVDEPK